MLRRLPYALALAFPSVLVLVVLFAPGLAHAQQVAIFQRESLPRTDPEGNQLQKRPLTLNPEGVSYQDCKDDQRIRFTISLSGFATNGVFEVWAGLSGNKCAEQQVRTGANPTCWRVTSGIPLQINTQINIPVRTIMQGAQDPKATDTSDAICGRIDLTNISLNFQYYAPGQLATPAANETVDIKVDTIGPPALTGVTVLPGSTRLHVAWTAVGEGGVQDLTGVSVYCAPTAGGGDAAATETVCNDPIVTSDGGDAEVVTEDAGCTQVPADDSTCSSDAFRATSDASTTVIPDDDFDERFLCGRLAGNTGAGVTAEAIGGQPLVNDTRYAVAIAATDSFGNRGALSSPNCARPEETNDFWAGYKRANGQAGGGFCSSTGGASAAGSGAALGVVALTMASALRRRAQRRGGRR